MNLILIEVKKQEYEQKDEFEKSLASFYENCDINELMGSDGNPSVIIELINLSKEVLPQILTFTLGYITRKKVKRIVVGGWDVENPTEEMIKIFEEKLREEIEYDSK